MCDTPSFAETHTALYLQSTRLTLSRAVAKYMPAIMLRSAHILALQIYHRLPRHHANHAPCVMIMNAQYEAASPPPSPWRENPFTIESGQVHIWTNQPTNSEHTIAYKNIEAPSEEQPTHIKLKDPTRYPQLQK